MWGQATTTTNGQAEIRIIPTRVGTRTVFRTFQRHLRDHPHACGDKLCVCHKITPLKGSSPRVWGQAQFPVLRVHRAGIIPTRVGTSALECERSCKQWDHPHACGDKHSERPFQRFIEGSSPRVWGQEFYIAFSFCLLRIIPTRVGTSNTGYSFGKHLQDHPHACGDKLSNSVYQS